ncbi:cell division protein Fic [Synergistales bacterium]|nr:cell division protein Fic [Synergistales bacterium]
MDFSAIDELKARLDSLRPLNSAELKRLREEFIIENTYDSNAIEGNTLTLRETALILRDGLTIAGKPIKEHLEAIGHRDAFGYITELAEAKHDNAFLTERVVKELHSLVLMNDAKNRGLYRNMAVRIVGAAHAPPPPYLVREQMENLISAYNDGKSGKHIIEAAAEFHIGFENIHPFIDGNGRTGRLILNLELIRAGFLPVNIKFADRGKYYDCFDDFHISGGVSDAMTRLILGYETEELSKRITMLE